MTQEQINAELKRIQDKVPKLWKDNIYHEVAKTPALKNVVEKMLAGDKINDELREKLTTLRDAGEFDKKRVLENPKYAKMIDELITREIKKSVKEGRLPKDATKYSYGFRQ